MAITDVLNLTPQLVAEQNPELHQMRKIAFGENYLQDIEQGTGTSQYYSGWGNVPSWAQQAMTTDEAYTTPAVTGSTTNIGVGGGPDSGIMSVTPTDTISGMPGSMPTVPAGGMEGGVWGPMDYLQPITQEGEVVDPTTMIPQTGTRVPSAGISYEDDLVGVQPGFPMTDLDREALGTDLEGIGMTEVAGDKGLYDVLNEAASLDKIAART